jgi:hypothetical protein
MHIMGAVLKEIAMFKCAGHDHRPARDQGIQNEQPASQA